MPTLDWIGKAAVVNHHQEVPTKLLHCDGRLSAGDPEAGNLLVEGDNLEALKALLPYYGGQVKCIYIDPPYNTGNEGWTYNDNVNSPEIRAWLNKVVGKEGEDFSRHDKWLCMMYPRLRLLKDFLTRDGCIVVSIDENEFGPLTLLLDELFDRQNRAGTIVWQKGKKGDAKLLPVIHEYIVIYARDKSHLTAKKVKWRKRKAGADEVLEYYQSLRDEHGSNHEAIRAVMMTWYRSLKKDDPRKAHKHYNWSDDRGLYFAADFAGPDDGRDTRPRYEILHPKTGKPCKIPSTGWRWEEDTTTAALAMEPPRIHFGKTAATIPNRKSYLFEIDQEPLQSVIYKDGRAATLQVEGILGPGAFQFPKDVEVLAEIIGVLTSDGDIVLDSFAGSASTGHALLKLNHLGEATRRFVLIELDQETAREKTAPRLAAAIGGYTEKVEPHRQIDGLGGGFRYCTLGKPLFDEWGCVTEGVTFGDLAAFIFFSDSGNPIPTKATGTTSLLGTFGGRAIHLLWSANSAGVADEQAGNVLTPERLAALPKPSDFDGPVTVYAEGCTVSPERLASAQVSFRQIPYQVAGA